MNASRQERLAVLVLTVLLFLGYGAWSWRQQRFSLTAAAPAMGVPVAETVEQEPEPEVVLIRVHVSGAVEAEDVYELPQGSRVVDALAAAGGASADGAPHVLNLAAFLADGDKVWVPTQREVTEARPAAAQGSVTWSSTPAPGPVNINTAGAEVLQTLPGIGPVLAERIIQYRRQYGSFTTVDDLKLVSGIGDKRFEDLKDRVTVR